MSVLTKVFVVLVNVLSVALVAATIAFVANQENFKQKYQDQVATTGAANAAANAAKADKALADQTQSELKSAMAQQEAELKKQVTDAQSLAAQAQAALAAAKSDASKQGAEVTRLSATLAQNETILKASLEELTSRRAEAIKLQTKMVELSDRNNDLQNQLDALNRTTRRLSEQLADLETKNKDLQEKWAKVSKPEREAIDGGPSGASVTITAPAPGIVGQVTRIETANGTTFAQINVGRADKVSANMKFLVYRGEKFMGNLIIKSVSDTASVGALELLQGAVQAGDKVQSGVF